MQLLQKIRRFFHSDTTAQLAELYTHTHVPLPSMPLKLEANASENTICTALDDYFRDIISGYAPHTKQLLEDMYFKHHHIVPTPGMMSNGRYARTGWEIVNGKLIATVEVEQEIMKCPILLRWNKIHEIGGHVGQAFERREHIGLNKCWRELENTTFSKFMEQSIAPAEKILLDAIPLSAFERDFARLENQEPATIARERLLARRAMSIEDYTALKHRDCNARIGGEALTAEDKERFLQRDDIQAFMREHGTHAPSKANGAVYSEPDTPTMPNQHISWEAYVSNRPKNSHTRGDL